MLILLLIALAVGSWILASRFDSVTLTLKWELSDGLLFLLGLALFVTAFLVR